MSLIIPFQINLPFHEIYPEDSSLTVITVSSLLIDEMNVFLHLKLSKISKWKLEKRKKPLLIQFSSSLASCKTN